jgi:CO/xanthine dehydrogenase Mo-binding subunit
MAPPAALANAVEDALGHLGVRVEATPLTAARIASLLHQAVPEHW